MIYYRKTLFGSGPKLTAVQYEMSVNPTTPMGCSRSPSVSHPHSKRPTDRLLSSTVTAFHAAKRKGTTLL